MGPVEGTIPVLPGHMAYSHPDADILPSPWPSTLSSHKYCGFSSSVQEEVRLGDRQTDDGEAEELKEPSVH